MLPPTNVGAQIRTACPPALSAPAQIGATTNQCRQCHLPLTMSIATVEAPPAP